MLVTGVAGILAGIFTFVAPGITAIALVYLIAAFAIVRGAMEIAAAIWLRKEIDDEWLLILAGIVSVIFGVVLFLFPGAGALALILWIAAFAVVIGVLEIVLGFKLKNRTPASAPTWPFAVPLRGAQVAPLTSPTQSAPLGSRHSTPGRANHFSISQVPATP